MLFQQYFIRLYKRTEAILWDLDLWPQSLGAVGVINSEGILNGIEKVVKIIYKKFDIVLVGSKSFIRIVRQRVPHNRVYYFPNWAENIIEENKIEFELSVDLIPMRLKLCTQATLKAQVLILFVK